MKSDRRLFVNPAILKRHQAPDEVQPLKIIWIRRQPIEHPPQSVKLPPKTPSADVTLN